MNNIFPSKVVIKKIKDSSLATLENSLQQALEQIGGFDELIKPGMTVFINNIALSLVKYFVWMKTKIDKENCSGCGVCTYACPTTALRFRNDEIIPTFERKMCINCWCCQTNCPSQTIFIEKSFAARKIFQLYRNKCVI